MNETPLTHHQLIEVRYAMTTLKRVVSLLNETIDNYDQAMEAREEMNIPPGDHWICGHCTAVYPISKTEPYLNNCPCQVMVPLLNEKQHDHILDQIEATAPPGWQIGDHAFDGEFGAREI